MHAVSVFVILVVDLAIGGPVDWARVRVSKGVGEAALVWALMGRDALPHVWAWCTAWSYIWHARLPERELWVLVIVWALSEAVASVWKYTLTT